MKDEAKTKKELISELQSFKRANTRLKKQLKEAEEKYKLFFEDSLMPTFITTLDGKNVVDANAQAIKLAGYSSKEDCFKEFVKGGRDADPHFRGEMLSELQSNGKVSNKEYRFFKKDGTPFWVDFNARIYSPKGWLIVEEVDISKRKRLENNLRKAQEELKKRVQERTTELEQTKDFMENIFHTAVEGIIVVDAQGYITMVNPAMAELLGYAGNELVGKNALVIRPEGKEHEEKGKEFVERLFENGSVDGLERTWLKKDGTLIDVEINAALLRDREGNHIGGIGSFKDITGRKQAEEELRRSKEFLESIFKSSVDGIIATDQQGTITLVNEAVEKMSGYSRDELLGMHTGELVMQGEAHIQEREKIIGKLLEEGTASGIVKWLKKDGSLIDIEMNMSLLPSEDGNFEGAVGVIRDISARKRAEKDLQESEAKYRELVQSSNSVILRMDIEGKITFFNKFAQRFFGFAEEEILGKNVVGTIVPEKDSTGRDLAMMIQDIGIHPEKYVINENENMRSNGEKVWLSWTNNIVVDQENKIKELLCFGNDITERKHAEEKLQETKEFLDNIIESSLDSIVIADTKGYITRTNRSFLQLIGCENGAQVTGKHIMEFAPQEKGVYESTTGDIIEIGDVFFEDSKEWMSQLMRDGKITTLETYHLNNENKLIPVEDTVNYIYNSDGAPVGTVGIIRDITERKEVESLLQRQKHDLEERFKELTCLFNISKLSQNLSITGAALLQGIVDLIPPAWQYPEITCARIIFKDQAFSTKEFRETPWRQSTDIVISGKKAGLAEVCYLEERPKSSFLKEEENLLQAIGREIGSAISLRQAEKKLTEYQSQLRSLSSQLTLIEERERRKFATYIHDQIGQALFSAKIQLEALQDAVPHVNGQQSVIEIAGILEQVIKDSRNLTFEVGAPILYQLGIEAALEGLVEKINKDGKLLATYRSDKKVKSLDEDISIFLFRVVQELLNNVAKHAYAHNVEVSIYREATQTFISVEDDGIGFQYSEVDPLIAEDCGFGLFSVKERLVHFGGKLLVESAFGKGTCITLVVP